MFYVQTACTEIMKTLWRLYSQSAEPSGMVEGLPFRFVDELPRYRRGCANSSLLFCAIFHEVCTMDCVSVLWLFDKFVACWGRVLGEFDRWILWLGRRLENGGWKTDAFHNETVESNWFFANILFPENIFRSCME